MQPACLLPLFQLLRCCWYLSHRQLNTRLRSWKRTPCTTFGSWHILGDWCKGQDVAGWKKRLSSRFCKSWWCKRPWFQDMICFIVGSTSRKWPTNMIWDSWLNHAAACTDMPLKRICISASGSSVAIFTESNNLIGSYWNKTYFNEFSFETIGTQTRQKWLQLVSNCGTWSGRLLNFFKKQKVSEWRGREAMARLLTWNWLAKDIMFQLANGRFIGLPRRRSLLVMVYWMVGSGLREESCKNKIVARKGPGKICEGLKRDWK